MRYAVLIGIIIIAAPLLLRISSPEPFPDAESYTALREADLQGYDALFARPHTADPSDMLYSKIPAQLALILLAGVTLFALSIYYGSEAFLLLLATSPVFITMFTRAGEAPVGVTAIALGVMLISKRQYWAVIIIPFCFWLSFSLGILASLTFITVALASGMPFIALGTSFFALLSGVVVTLVAESVSIGIHLPQPAQALSILTTTTSITVFLIGLGVIGFLVQYMQSKRKAEQLLLLLLIPFAFFFDHGNIIIAAFLAYLGAKAWHFLQERKWQFEEIRTLTLVLIACGILFTALLTVRDRVTLDEDRVEATRFITAAYPSGTPIAADADLAPVLAYYGYPSRVVALPEDRDLIAAALRSEDFVAIASREPQPPFRHFPIVYSSGGYKVYRLPN